MPSPRLVERLRARDRDALPELLTACARQMVAVAYVVLQDRHAADQAAALAIARCWRQPPDAWPPEPRALRAWLATAAAREALALRETAREVDPLPQPGAHELLALDPEQRATVALEHLAGVPGEEAVAALRLRGAARRRALAGPKGASSALERIRRAVAENVAGLPVTIEPRAVVAFLDQPLPSPPAAWRRVLPTVAGLATAGLLTILLLSPPSDGASVPPASGAPNPEATSPAAPARPVLPSVAELASAPSLADCGIRPSDADLAFAGWTTLTQLGGSAPMLAASQPVYAQVPRGEVVWDPRGDAPPGSTPRERLACLTDPARRLHVVVRVPGDWEAPEIVDGCPASPMGQAAGMREIGGPNGFVVLPGPGTSWWADDPSVRILARVASSPRGGQSLTAWAQPLGPGEPRRLQLATPSGPDESHGGSTSYLWLEHVRFPAAGCWVVSLAVDGNVVGSAILPVSERIAAAD